eukprot:192815-Amphidinium_carterae.1
MEKPTHQRHSYYNFHTEVHYAITDYINLYLYNIPDDFGKTHSVQFTQQDYYFAVVHTTDRLLRQMTAELQLSTQRTDMT